MQFYCLNMFRAPICPSSGVQLVNTARWMWPGWFTSSEQCSLKEAQCGTTQAVFQVWPPKSGRYSPIVLLMMGILMPETCWGNKAAYFVASSRFFTFTVPATHGHISSKFNIEVYGLLGCNAAWLGKWFLIFWRNVVLWLSGDNVFCRNILCYWTWKHQKPLASDMASYPSKTEILKITNLNISQLTLIMCFLRPTMLINDLPQILISSLYSRPHRMLLLPTQPQRLSLQS
jgi:hypothetical protein